MQRVSDPIDRHLLVVKVDEPYVVWRLDRGGNTVSQTYMSRMVRIFLGGDRVNRMLSFYE